MNTSNKNLITLIVLDVIILVIAVSVLGFRYLTLAGPSVSPEISKPLSAIKQSSDYPEPIFEKPGRDLTVDYGSETPVRPNVPNNKPQQKPEPTQTQQSVEPSMQQDTRRIGFTYFNSKCRKVEVVGDFNNWKPAPMEKLNEKQWSLAIPVEQGEFAYNFIVDGRPILDPNNTKTCDVGRGYKNSLLKVKPLKER